MNPSPAGFAAGLIFSLAIVAIIGAFTKIIIDNPPDPTSAAIMSLILGFFSSLCIVFFLKGLNPFFHGIHLPLKVLLFIVPLIALFLLPAVATGIEITRNVILDSLLVACVLGFVVLVMPSGFYTVREYDKFWQAIRQVMVVGLFLGVVIRAILWALE